MKCKVTFYSGYKGQETPRAVIIDNREYKIEKVIWRKRIRDTETGEISNKFKCQADNKNMIITLYVSGKSTAVLNPMPVGEF
jgi:hypothetical protein